MKKKSRQQSLKRGFISARSARALRKEAKKQRLSEYQDVKAYLSRELTDIKTYLQQMLYEMKVRQSDFSALMLEFARLNETLKK